MRSMKHTARVVPGTYDLFYGGGGVATTTAPRNQNAKLQSVPIAAAGTTTLDIDVPSVVVSGMLKINGATVTSAADAGTLMLRSATGDTVPLGTTSAGSYSIRAVPGSYDVYYQVGTAGATVPRNVSAKVRSGAVVATGTTALDIDVPVSPVTGSIRINAMVNTSTADYGTLSLRSGTLDVVNLAASYAGTYSTRVIPGSYDLVYQVAAAGALAPRNTLAKLRCFNVP